MVKLLLTASLAFFLGMLVKRAQNHCKCAPPVRLSPLSSLSKQTGTQWRFAEVIEETTHHKVLTFDSLNPDHQIIREEISAAAERVRLEMNMENAPIRSLKRINEASRFFENRLQTILHEHPDFHCQFPKTRAGKKQRSGYPDLTLEHLPSETHIYLDPKLFHENSLNSSFRTFYFEPNREHLKVNEDALHLLLGFAHDGKSRAWTFTKVHLVDLSKIGLKLKAEFSSSNRKLYSSGSIGTGTASQ